MRKGRAKQRPLIPDPRYGDTTVSRFVNNMMLDGKKSIAYKIFYEAMDYIEEKTKENPLEQFKKSLENCTPAVEVRSRRVGGATFQIPREVRQTRRVSLGMRWLISYARKRNGRSMAQKLGEEIIAAAKEEGAAYKKKEDTHRMAEANKAFSHFRF